MPFLRSLGRVVADSVRRALEDDIVTSAAALGFYALLSIFPLLLGLIIVGSLLIDEQQILAAADVALAQGIPVSRDVISQTVQAVYSGRGPASILSVVLLLWSGTRIFGGLQRALNKVWQAESSRGFVRQQVMRLAMLGATMVGMVLVVVLAPLLAYLTGLPVFELPIAGSILWSLVPALAILGVVALLYRFVPAAETTWQTVIPGAVLAALGFEVAKRVFVLAVDNVADYSLIYGSFAGIILIQLWCFVASIILLYGAEFGIAWGQYIWQREDARSADERRQRRKRIERRAVDIEQELERRREWARLHPGEAEPPKVPPSEGSTYEPFKGEA